MLLSASVVLTGANSDITSLLTPIYGAEMAHFSRDRESAADETALHALHCHYGHVGGAKEFFERLAENGEGQEWALSHYFASHPDAQSRIDALDALIRASGYVPVDTR